MLPDAPPPVPGINISAICHPSRMSAETCMTFFHCRKAGSASSVADVSGKGVPASLYMTLTKGLLESVTDTPVRPW
jgi:serine phosphatase RsbU (regulator of sigma subunit)